MRVPVAQEPGPMGLVLVFMTLDDLRYRGPLALRMWLERQRPPRRPGPQGGEVLEFRPAGAAEGEE